MRTAIAACNFCAVTAERIEALTKSADAFIGANALYRAPGRPMVVVGMDEFVALCALLFP